MLRQVFGLCRNIFSAKDASAPSALLKQERCAIAKMTARCALYETASHISSQSWTRVKLNGFLIRFLVSPKFSHVPLEVGASRLGYEERRYRANFPCN